MRVIATLAAVMLGLAAPASAAVSPADIERARATVLTDSYQKELPGYEGRAGSGTARPRDPRMGERVPRESARRVDTREHHGGPGDGGALGSLLSILLWGCLAVGLGLGLFWLATELTKYDEDARLPPEEEAAARDAATAAIIEKPLGDADELAARGQFAEAIHTLLLQTLHELARSAMVRVERSHTSREILARVPLLADAREALAGLITAVELTHFGDEPANAADYARCREQFNRFAVAFRSGLAVQQRMPQAGGGTAVAS